MAHLGTVCSNDRHGGTTDISGADTANLQVKLVAHDVDKKLDIIKYSY